MTIYVYNILSIVVVGILSFYVYRTESAKKTFFIFAFLQMLLISGLRSYDVGHDTRTYINIFNIYGSLDFSTILLEDFKFEKGYLIFQYVIYNIFNNPTLLFFLVSSFFLFSVAIFIYKNSKYPLLSVVIFIGIEFFAFSMTGLRQTMAIAIILFSYEFIKNRKPVYFILLVLLASTFHLSALVFLPFYFISYIKVSKPYLLLMFPIIALSFVYREMFFEFINIFTRLPYYEMTTRGPINLSILLLLTFIGGIIQCSLVLENNKNSSIYFHTMYITLILIGTAFINPNMLRLTFYYSFALLLFIPEIVFSFSDKRLRSILHILIISGVIFLYMKNLLGPLNPYVPYQFFWQ
jgi:hypothetical protein